MPKSTLSFLAITENANRDKRKPVGANFSDGFPFFECTSRERASRRATNAARHRIEAFRRYAVFAAASWLFLPKSSDKSVAVTMAPTMMSTVHTTLTGVGCVPTKTIEIGTAQPE